MKLMWHIVRKDLRRLRWQLAAWLAVVGAKYAIGYGVIWGGVIAEKTFGWLERVVVALGAGEVVLTFFLTALLVQGDALVGSRQFWLTRPISGGRLLGAKILGVGLLLVAPVLALAVPWWLVCGFNLTWMTMAAVELIAWQLLAVVPAFLVASLTDTFGRFVVWSVILLWLVMMAPFYTQWAAVKWMGSSAGEAEALTAERMLAAGVLVAVVVALVVTMQYVRRRWVRSVIVLAGGCLLALGIGSLWVRLYPPIRQLREVQPEWNVARAAGVKLEWVGAPTEKGGAPAAKDGAYVRSRLLASGWPDEVWMAAKAARLTWRWRDGTEYVADGLASSWAGRERALQQAFGGDDSKNDDETQRWLRDHPPRRRPSPPATSTHNVWSSVRVPAAIAERMQREPSQLRQETDFVFLEPRFFLATKLRPGGWTAREGHGLRIKQVGPAADNVGYWERPRVQEAVAVVESFPQLLIDSSNWLRRFAPALELLGWRWVRWYDSKIVVNRGYGGGWVNYRSGSSVLQISSVALRAPTLLVSAPKVVRDGKWVLAHPGWFDGAELATLDWVTVARFTREVTVEDFQIAK